MASICWHISGNSFLLPVFLLLLLLCPHNSIARDAIDVSQGYPSLSPLPGGLTARTPKCDQKFVSTPDGPLNGTFHAPTLINPEGDPRQCVYTFLAGPRQRVELIFTSFGLRGKPPDGSAVGELPACIHEYMDIYSEIRSENTTKLIETPFGGRFCGPIPPRRRVSLYQGIALSFFTDKNVTLPNIFSGIYRFLNASEYEVGTPEPSTPCTFIIHAETKRTGNILSPTYPGTYPKDLICSYQFVGQRGQRVRLEFRDFDLFFGGPQYIFETEYKIPGTAAPDGSCTFTYRSSSRKRGEFNSPRYPSNYPSDTNCTYFFLATPNEQVALIFDHFKVRTRNNNVTAGRYGYELCQDDWLEIYNMYRDDTEKLIGRYCGATAPGPVESNLGALGLKVILHSDSELVYSGFKARYTFEIAKPIFGDCGSNISSLNYGIITSPNFPNKYDGPAKNLTSKTCNWFIRVRPNQQILLNFELFSVEGDPIERGCPAAVLRMWDSLTSAPREFCGVKDPDAKWSFLSEDNNMRLSFISADKAVGHLGFRAVWTEVGTNEDCENQFLCSKSKYCIDESLRCNNIDNCGPDDSSDEENCVAAVKADSYTLPIAYAVGSILVILMLCLICHRRLRRQSHNMPSHELSPQRILPNRHHCFHDDLLHHQHQNHASTHNFNQYQLEQPSPPSESDCEGEADEPEPSCNQEISSPDSM
ncbi:cubilin isoform X8 [Solenopsis invicta]|uniref:cubilin isoform X8 n=1 Tax=Solenopsis invicta TaxID=13686 RepID=UPI00193E9EE4|nr:cubilin isoform X8 [Solenopsis invicta]